MHWGDRDAPPGSQAPRSPRRIMAFSSSTAWAAPVLGRELGAGTADDSYGNSAVPEKCKGSTGERPLIS